VMGEVKTHARLLRTLSPVLRPVFLSRYLN